MTDKSQGTPKDKSLYFDGKHWFFKSLRFFNLLEPGRPVLSLTKGFFFVMMFVMLYTLINYPDNLVAVLAAAGSTAMSLLAYVYRKHVQDKNGHFKVEETPDLVDTLKDTLAKFGIDLSALSALTKKDGKSDEEGTS